MIRATGTTTLGFFVWVLAFTALTWAASVATKWLELRRNTAEPFRNALRNSEWAGLFVGGAVFVLVLFMFGVFVIRTIYDDHEDLAAAIRQLNSSNARLKAEVEERKNSIFTTDPVFPNIIYLLQAFNIYRHALNGAPCVIKVTAPPDNNSLASVVAQFSNSVSGCFTFGPFDTRSDPDVERETMDNMVPGMIVFHAAKDDKAANQLFINLGNLIQSKRSYQLPRVNYQLPPHVEPASIVWLQFGTNTKWNSEINRPPSK